LFAARLLHGLPGYESSGDLAQSIRRAGWNVVFFHYRGTWGTKLLVVYHTVAFRPGIAAPKFLSSLVAAGASRSTEGILKEEISSRYSGQFAIGHDLDVY